MTNATYRKLTTGIISAWLIISLSASALNAFKSDSRPSLAIAGAAIAPIILFLLWFSLSTRFRQFTLSLNPRILTGFHVWRINGFAFLVLQAYGILPSIFASPAGWGDIIIGATAPWVAWKFANPEYRKSFLFWQVLGIADLVMAVGLGTTARLINPHVNSMGAMTVLPLSLIPTFLVPLFLIFHIICIAQAKRWPERPRLSLENQLPSSAV